MDLHDIWQENKRWILCCLLGLVIYWVGGYVVESVWSDQTVVRAIQRSQSQVQGDQYDQGALKAAKTESEALKAVRGRLAKALVFDPGDDFRLAGKGDPELWWDRRSRAVKEEVMSRADEEGVELAEKALEWPVPTERDEIESTLIGLSLLRQSALRLIDAYRTVLAADAEMAGPLVIESMKVESGRRGATSFIQRRRKSRPGEGLVQEERMRFVFRATEPVIELFLEACRSEDPPLAVAEFKAMMDRRPGDPLKVTGALTAISLSRTQ